MAVPLTRYVRSGDGVHIAYQVVGEGPPDVVFVPNWGTHLETVWTSPWAAEFWSRMSSMGRLLVFDARGTGASDPLGSATSVSIEQTVDDLVSVIAAAGADSVILVGIESAAAVACACAAAHPDLVRGLILYAGTASILDRGEGVGLPLSARDEVVEAIVRDWGDPDAPALRAVAPGGSRSADRSAMARTQRLAMSPIAARAFAEMLVDVDVRDVLPRILAPTLVMHRRGDRLVPIGHAHVLADRIPNASLVELDGDEHSLVFGDIDDALDRIEAFVTGSPARDDPHGATATVMFTDIVGSTALAAEMGDVAWRARLRAHDRLVRNELARFGGEEIKTTGDGFLALFADASDCIRCASAVRQAVLAVEIDIRVGVHTGRFQRLGPDIAGISVHVCQRLCSLAGAGQILISSAALAALGERTVGVIDRGDRVLNGVPGHVRVYEVRREPS